jgi:hypothetical protein
MEYRSIIFYFSLFLSIGCVAEIYVRMKGMGDKVEKIRGVSVPNEPKLIRPFALLIVTLITAAMTWPR